MESMDYYYFYNHSGMMGSGIFGSDADAIRAAWAIDPDVIKVDRRIDPAISFAIIVWDLYFDYGNRGVE